MEKLYYDNRYLKEFTAEIVDIKEIDNKFHVILDKTAFFQEVADKAVILEL